MSKKNTFLIGVFSTIFIILSIVFYVYDLDISISFASDNPPFIFSLLHAIGEFPIYLGPILFGLVYGFTSKEKKYKLLFHAIGLFATYIGCVRLIDGIFETFYSSKLGSIQYILIPLESVLIYLLLMYLFNKFKYENLVKIRDIALIYFLVSVFSFAIVTGLKMIWGRMRYCYLPDDYSGYTNFLKINFLDGFKGSEYNSFPSGHTNAAASSLVLLLIPHRLAIKKWKTYITFFLSLAYTILVAVSRVGYGAHYASDVLYGFMISISSFIIIYHIFKKKGWLYVRNN